MKPQPIDITEVILVLGKRLVNSQLTAESESRVSMLVKYLVNNNVNSSVLIFCGGQLQGQTVSEAEAMYQAFTRACSNWQHSMSAQQILIESRSTTTVENIANAAHELIASGLCQPQQAITIRLCSNDYHLKRIIDIERLMPEQGLLNRLKESAQKSGLQLSVPLDEKAHLAASYPHNTPKGQVFLLIEQLTFYRVYLEGVVSGVFQRSLEEVRSEPAKIAFAALQQLKTSPLMSEAFEELNQLERIIEHTKPSANQSVSAWLIEFNQILLALNRRFDPEAD